jgi:hypothetical protein
VKIASILARVFKELNECIKIATTTFAADSYREDASVVEYLIVSDAVSCRVPRSHKLRGSVKANCRTKMPKDKSTINIITKNLPAQTKLLLSAKYSGVSCSCTAVPFFIGSCHLLKEALRTSELFTTTGITSAVAAQHRDAPRHKIKENVTSIRV